MKPYIFDLPETYGKGGKLSFIENPTVPFEVKRVYWIYGLESGADRGGHSHLNSDRVLICLSGSVSITLESDSGNNYNFQLKKPSEALFFPRQHWMTMQCSDNAILLSLVSCKFEDDLYQKDYSVFKQA